MVQDYFRQAFERADARGDIPDYIDPDELKQQQGSESNEDAPPVPADIPEWLRTQMQGPPEEAIVGAGEDDEDAETIMATLFAQDDEATADDADALDFDTLDLGDVDDSDMPEWLRDTGDTEQVETVAAVPQDEKGAEPEIVEDELPDWLRDDLAEETDFAEAGIDAADTDLSDIFAASVTGDMQLAADDEPAMPVPSEYYEVDTSDPWVEAFVLENEKSEEMAEWYSTRLQQLHIGAEAEAPAQPAAIVLQAAKLPTEASLPAGQPESVPSWMSTDGAAVAPVTPEPQAETAPAAEVVPDWVLDAETIEDAEDAIPAWLVEEQDQSDDEADVDLREMATNDIPDWLVKESQGTPEPEMDSDDIPEWLLENMQEQEAVAETLQLDQPATSQGPLQPAASMVTGGSPAPISRTAAALDVPSTLANAREKVKSGAIERGMQDYEAIVRANAALEDVSKDLSALMNSKDQKRNPAVHRVMGDVLMRQGRLQEALDTYRKALQLL